MTVTIYCHYLLMIYIDPPLFSGRNHNVIFDDQNELRSFSDIWEGGMPGCQAPFFELCETTESLALTAGIA